MEKTYKFTLKISRENTIEARWHAGDQEETVSNHRISEEANLRQDITSGLKALRQPDPEVTEAEIQRLGRDLYRALFPDRVGQLFEQALSHSLIAFGRGNAYCLRVIVDLHPKSDAFGWPLEFLYCPARGGYWLATEKPWIALSRRTDFGGTFDRTRQSWPLRVLVIVSKPESLKGVLTSKVLQEIGKLAESKSNEAGLARKMEVKVLGHLEDYEQQIAGIEYLDLPATWGNIRNITSSNWQPHVVHFIGHGKLEEEEGFLALISGDRNVAVHWCNAENTTKLFGSPPRLILLQACESAAPQTTRGYMSLATSLLQRNILAVIAMQFEIRNDDAIQFAVGFYEALRDGLDVDAAVQSGRWKISNKPEGWSKRYFGGPVLYMYEPFGIIQPASARPKSRPGSHTPAYSTTTGEPLNALDQAKRMLTRASDLIDRAEEPTARIWIESAQRKLSAIGAERVIQCVEGALEMLELEDTDGAVKMLAEAQRALLIVPSAQTPARASPPPTKIEPAVSAEAAAEAPSLEVAQATESGWRPEADLLSRDRIKRA